MGCGNVKNPKHHIKFTDFDFGKGTGWYSDKKQDVDFELVNSERHRSPLIQGNLYFSIRKSRFNFSMGETNMQPVLDSQAPPFFFLNDNLKQNIAFSGLSWEVREKVINKFEPVLVDANKVLFTEGSSATYFFILHEGMIRVETRRGTFEQYPGFNFGEMALLSCYSRREFSVITTNTCVFYRLHKDDYKKCVESFDIKLEEMQQKVKILFLNGFEIFRKLLIRKYGCS